MKGKFFLMLALVCFAAGCVNPPQGQSNAVSTLAGSPATVLVVKESEVKDDSSITFDYQGSPAVLIAVAGKYYAYYNKCTKEGCKMAYKGGKLICPCCGSIFDATSGDPLSGPAKLPLSKLQITVTDGVVYASG
jgi:nitrite reductase/ring-hydroxylating ferredoxin subunit